MSCTLHLYINADKSHDWIDDLYSQLSTKPIVAQLRTNGYNAFSLMNIQPFLSFAIYRNTLKISNYHGF